MSTAVIPFQKSGELDIASLSEIGAIFSKSGYFKDVRDAAQAVVKIMYGRELGFSPVISMSGIHIIEGKPALSANLMAAMIKRSGRYNYRVDTLNDTVCRLIFTENGVEVGVSDFSMADAQRAKVVKEGSGWQKYPRNMMFARALSNGLKLYCPDLSMCPIYNPEELGAEVNEDGAVTSHPVSAPVTTDKPRTFGAPAKIEPLPPLEELVASATAAADKKPEIEYIQRPMQVNFARSFREALPKALQPGAEKIRHEWLSQAGYVDADGNPSSSMIPLATFEEVKAKAVQFAGEQQ